MTDYHRFYISGSTWFFTVNLAERRNNRLLVDQIDLLRAAFAYVKRRKPFAMEAVGKSDEEIASDVPHVLELVDLSHRHSHFPQELSGGEQQRLAIARAIINQPELIIADEPTGNLDPVNTYEIVQILKRINDLGTTVILTTHNRGVIESVGKRVITMEKGKIVRDTKHHGKEV